MNSFSVILKNVMNLKSNITSDWLNSIPKDKILDWSKLKAFADDEIKVLEMMIFVLDRVENILGKGKMLVTSIFSFSRNVFRALFT